ncbi:serine/threonine-protein kinase, partial [Mycobacterium sp.]|uniref:serine/threonine-protein kinase n=1 Tax=Mycobacterium sp. TaxID=1785 RepID=UPI003C73B505
MSQGNPGLQGGSWFGPYRLLRLLGRGGMGEVYEAEDTRKRRVVALKLISPQYSSDPTFRARMQREADAAGRLTEPHVVPIHDYGEIDGKLYVEMRLVDGAPLHDILRRDGPLSPPRAAAIVRQIASALDAAHAAGVTHRDVKPENILLTGEDFAYLVDFGIARAAADPGLTQTGTAMGTYKYMAPERFAGDDVTYRSDIYSLACVLCECLTGSPPFRSDSIERAIAAHLTEPPPRPSQLRPGTVPVALDQVVATGMAKNPLERYRSAGDLAKAALEALTVPDQHQAESILRQGEDAAGAATMARPVPAGAGSGQFSQPGIPSGYGPPPLAQGPDFGHTAPGPRRSRKLWLVIAAAVVVLLAVVGYLVWPQHHAGPSSDACGQNVLPFNGLDFRLSPGGVAVDSSGAVYVASEAMFGRVVKLASGSSTPSVLPFTGLYQP